MNSPLDELVTLSRLVGQDSTLVQGSGGNTSVKTKDGCSMYIKASGTALKDLSKERGWRRLNVARVLSILNDNELSQSDTREREAQVIIMLQASCDDGLDTDARPSVESPFHALLDNVVIHLHPLAVAAFVCARNGQAELKRLFCRDGRAVLWIPYASPGFELASCLGEEVASYMQHKGRRPPVLFLQNHGLVVSAKTSSAALALVRDVVNGCRAAIKSDGLPSFAVPDQAEVHQACRTIRQSVNQVTGNDVIVRHFIDNAIIKFLALDDARELAALPAVVPEELAYSNGPAVWMDHCDRKSVVETLKARTGEGQRPPTSFIVRNLGLFVSGTERAIPMIREVISASLFIRRCARAFGGVSPLTKTQRDFIEGWEAEHFRISLANKK